MTKQRLPVRQGDIVLIPITKRQIPKGLATVDRDNRGRIVLAEGETTGHAHAILENPATLFRQADLDEMADRFLAVEKEGVELVHEEHGTIKLDKGNYIVRHKREYVPREIPRAVID
jgi:hypothetical protein